MLRRRVLQTLLAAAVARPIAAGAQAAGKSWRIGYLSAAPVEGDRNWVKSFRDGLRELGYREGDNTHVEQRHAAQRLDRLPALAAELVQLRVDVVVANGTPAVLAAKRAHPTLPIVMTVNADPVGAGLVASLARPGGNITGNTDGHADIGPKRLDLLRAAVPKLARVAVIWNPATPQAARQFENVGRAAPALGVTLVHFPIAGPQELETVFVGIAKSRAEAAFIIPDQSWAQGQERRIGDLALKGRLATSGTRREFADAGCLMSYGANFHDLWRKAAVYVDKILKGAAPSDLPIEQPTKFELVINMRTARRLGLTIPAALLHRADVVID